MASRKMGREDADPPLTHTPACPTRQARLDLFFRALYRHGGGTETGQGQERLHHEEQGLAPGSGVPA